MLLGHALTRRIQLHFPMRVGWFLELPCLFCYVWWDSDVLLCTFFVRLNPWHGSLGVFLSLLPQFGAALIAACALYQEQQQSGASGQLDRGQFFLNPSLSSHLVV
jgi:hypothetical protein